jgi:UDP-N-acetylglucosamine diphosphorylase/glucosamine-1-phosphate N-acetyltransferase
LKLYIFDDRPADEWDPFSLSRPCSELLFGVMSLRQRLERFAGTPADGLLSRAWLGSFAEDGAPPAIAYEHLPAADRLLLSSRAVPEPGARFEPPDSPCTLEIDGEVVGAYLPSGLDAPDAEWLSAPAPLPGGALVVEGAVLQKVWELVSESPDRTARDLATGLTGIAEAAGSVAAERIGDATLQIADDVRIEPGVLLDLRDGPICLDRGVEVLAGSRLTGPLYAGPSSRLLGGTFSSVTAGPHSYLRGEIEESVILGYTNKAHDGFLGHAYVGRWVNLGALTTNSDLKNTYGSVRLAGPSEEVDTGLLKFGCLIGDHVKTAIGTLIPTGAVIGCGANVFDGAPGKWTPPFSWGDPSTVHRLDGFLRTADLASQRRDVEFGDAQRAWLADVWESATETRR